MHTYKKINGDMANDDKWHVGYYTLEINYSIGAAGGPWLGGIGGGGGPILPPVVSTWQFLSEHDNEEVAMDRVNYLNGGSVTI